jgi:hypothetical protein
MEGSYLLSSAYFPPINYISLISRAGTVMIEKEENYLKQSYRNRCIILTSNGPAALSIPVLSGSLHKTPVKDIMIDYSRRWQQIHVRSLMSSYRSSAFFEYYFDLIEKVIVSNSKFLLDLNMLSLEVILNIAGISSPVVYTSVFEPVTENNYDYRYRISPKKKEPGISHMEEYYQVFNNKFGFVPGLSILDLIFNIGPDINKYLSAIRQIS